MLTLRANLTLFLTAYMSSFWLQPKVTSITKANLDTKKLSSTGTFKVDHDSFTL